MSATVLHSDLIDLLERSKWGEQRPAGVKRGSVKRASLKQTASGLELDAPNGVHTIAILIGDWPTETFFDGKALTSILEWLKTHDGRDDTVEISRLTAEIVFAVGGSRRRVDALSNPIPLTATREPPTAPKSQVSIETPPQQKQECKPPATFVEQAPVSERKFNDSTIKLQARNDVEKKYPELNIRHDYGTVFLMPFSVLLLSTMVFQGVLEAGGSFLTAEIVSLVFGASFIWLFQRERHSRFERLAKEREQYLLSQHHPKT